MAPRERPAVLGLIYFGVGFTLAATACMVSLTLARPLLGELSEGGRRLAMLAPLLLGVPYGARVAWLGRRDGLRLAAALRRGVWP